MGLVFEWDTRKAEQNIRKHGISFEEATSVFGDPLAGIIADPAHSEGEERYIVRGQSERLRILVVVYTERELTIRIISARVATNREEIV
jgi:uncharacterized DUF497 family protein